MCVMYVCNVCIYVCITIIVDFSLKFRYYIEHCNLVVFFFFFSLYVVVVCCSLKTNLQCRY